MSQAWVPVRFEVNQGMMQLFGQLTQHRSVNERRMLDLAMRIGMMIMPYYERDQMVYVRDPMQPNGVVQIDITTPRPSDRLRPGRRRRNRDVVAPAGIYEGEVRYETGLALEQFAAQNQAAGVPRGPLENVLPTLFYIGLTVDFHRTGTNRFFVGGRRPQWLINQAFLEGLHPITMDLPV